MSAPPQGSATPPYAPQLLYHGTGLSVTPSSANTFLNIGPPISVPRNGILVISIAAHVSGGKGQIQLQITRGSATYTIGAILGSLVTDQGYQAGSELSITRTSAGVIADQMPLAQGIASVPNTYVSYSAGGGVREIFPLLAGDILQFIATNNTANATTYIDDLMVMII